MEALKMTRLVHVYGNVLVLAMTLTACQVEPGANPVINTKVDSPTATPVVSATPPVETVVAPPAAPPAPALVPFNLTYRTMTVAIAPQAGPLITLIGHCVNYSGNVYCWDNGVVYQTPYPNQTFGTIFPPAGYTFFGVNYSTIVNSSNVYGNCWGACISDFLSSPTLMTANLELNMAEDGLKTPNQILTGGVPKVNSCVLTDVNTVTCQDFVINL